MDIPRKEERTWETKDGEEIPYSKIEDGHLLNILRWIEVQAENGVIIRAGGGGQDIDDTWYDQDELVGEDALKYFDYNGLKQEATKRNLI